MNERVDIISSNTCIQRNWIQEKEVTWDQTACKSQSDSDCKARALFHDTYCWASPPCAEHPRGNSRTSLNEAITSPHLSDTQSVLSPFWRNWDFNCWVGLCGGERGDFLGKYVCNSWIWPGIMRFLEQGKVRLEMRGLKTVASVPVVGCSRPFPTSSQSWRPTLGWSIAFFFFFLTF